MDWNVDAAYKAPRVADAANCQLTLTLMGHIKR